jgi:two-component system, NtrC family, sensor kinase
MPITLPFRFRTVLLALVTAGIVALAAINFDQRNRLSLPTDGVSWVETDRGLTAWIVDRGGAGERAGIEPADLLEAINGNTVRTTTEAEKEIYNAGIWSKAAYDLVRQGQKIRTEVVLNPQGNSGPLRDYLVVLGLCFLGIGAFILLRRRAAPRSLHFYLFCLSSFVLYTFSYTGKLNLFDSAIYWMNVGAWLLAPALFLHFCLRFPQRPDFVRERPYLLSLVYAWPLVLLGLHVAVMLRALVLPIPMLQERWLLDRAELAYLAAYFLLGAGALQYSYRRAQAPLIRQQLKWVTWGTVLAIGPFALVYILPYFLGFVPTGWMKLSVLSLAFLPLTFGYAIVHYRLMDVDIIFRRGMAYSLATAAIVGLYFGLVALAADLFRNHVSFTSHGGWFFAIILTAILFQPLLNWFQQHLNRLFDRRRPDYSRTLVEFATELTTERNMGRLLERAAEHLGEALGVDRVAIFVTEETGELRLARARGLDDAGPFDLAFLDPADPALAKGYLFFDSVRQPAGYSPSAQGTIERLALHYYLPFKLKERTLGYLGLGKTREGDLLSSEDVELLRTITGYVTIALENARLYESLETKARAYQNLKDFSENIIESINVGVIAVNLEQRVESWNTPMEALYGMPRAEAVGKHLSEVFAPELLAELPLPSDLQATLSLYKFRLRAPSGRERIVNLSLTPLVGKEGRVIGKLVMFNDLTERVELEDQLVQAEKLSSIGLLAAGVAHEVNTPLAVITSQAQMLMKQVPADDPKAKTLDRIIKQSFRASEIVNNLLKFSRTGGSEYLEVDVNRVIRETLALVEPMLRASKITLNTQLASDLPGVHGNSGKLQQVFMNLIMNARDAMPYGGELTLATESEDSTVRVEVSDNGVGIPAEHLSKIFDPFFTTKSTSRGTGLGLAVSYGIIREHGGKIEVESAVGKGASFRLEFPTARKAVHVS